MRVIAINGSPRKGWNTHKLLINAVEMASSLGADIELIHLGDLSYTGCTGCLSCKRKNSPARGSCVLSDDLKPVLNRIEDCDVLIIGSPLYFSEVTGNTRSFIERLLFQSLNYDKIGSTIRKKHTPTLLAYTANMTLEGLRATGMFTFFRKYEELFTQIFGPATTFLATGTLQTKDYAAHHMGSFDEQERLERHQTVFPLDCKRIQLRTSLLIQGSTDAMISDID